MNWIKLDSENNIEDIKNRSLDKRILIFKFSPRCAINILMRGLFEREWIEDEMEMKTYFLDIMEYPGLSKKIETEFNVIHQSPQILIIENKKCIYSASHGGVDYKKIRRYSNLRKIKEYGSQA